jgi:hypothetical protein
MLLDRGARDRVAPQPSTRMRRKALRTTPASGLRSLGLSAVELPTSNTERRRVGRSGRRGGGSYPATTRPSPLPPASRPMLPGPAATAADCTRTASATSGTRARPTGGIGSLRQLRAHRRARVGGRPCDGGGGLIVGQRTSVRPVGSESIDRAANKQPDASRPPGRAASLPVREARRASHPRRKPLRPPTRPARQPLLGVVVHQHQAPVAAVHAAAIAQMMPANAHVRLVTAQ